MSEVAERFERITPAPAYQLVADAIEREILTGRIKPGERIGTEAELVRQFGVNRSTVREGIRLLEQGGLIRRDTSRRLYASLPRYNRLASRISRALILHEVTFRELFQATIALEMATVEAAAEQATSEDLAAIEANIARTATALDDPAALSELDTEFHALIARASHNRVLLLAREPTSLLIYPTTEIIFTRVDIAAPRLLKAHRILLDALRRRDTETARVWMRRHVEDWRRGFERSGKDIDQPVERIYMDHVLHAGRRSADEEGKGPQ